MNAKDLTLIVVAKDEQSMRGFDQTHVNAAETILVINYRNQPLAQIANWHLTSYAENGLGSQLGCRKIFGLCHADALFGPGALDVFAQTAGEGAVCGMVGRSADPATHVWSVHKLHLDQHPLFREGPISTLDAVSVFFRRDSGLRFDAMNFDGFHMHVEDLCMQAHEKGIPVVVPPAEASTNCSTPFAGKWGQDCLMYRDRLRKKWAPVKIATTTDGVK